MKEKVIVLFPGRNYPVECPTLYYARQVAISRGYECITLRYSDISKDRNIDLGILADRLEDEVNEQLSTINWNEYNEIIFVSKSIGTVIAGRYQNENDIHVKNIYLTPLKETMNYMNANNSVVVIGEDDEYIDFKYLYDYCNKNNIIINSFEGVGHSFNDKLHIERSISILNDIVKIYEQYIK